MFDWLCDAKCRKKYFFFARTGLAVCHLKLTTSTNTIIIHKLFLAMKVVCNTHIFYSKRLFLLKNGALRGCKQRKNGKCIPIPVATTFLYNNSKIDASIIKREENSMCVQNFRLLADMNWSCFMVFWIYFLLFLTFMIYCKVYSFCNK